MVEFSVAARYKTHFRLNLDQFDDTAVGGIEDQLGFLVVVELVEEEEQVAVVVDQDNPN